MKTLKEVKEILTANFPFEFFKFKSLRKQNYILRFSNGLECLTVKQLIKYFHDFEGTNFELTVDMKNEFKSLFKGHDLQGYN